MKKEKIEYFEKLFLAMLVGAFFGLVIEEVFLFFRGIILNYERDNWVFYRSLMYGPLSPVYGIGAAVLTIFFAGKNYTVKKIFLLSSLLGGAVEFIVNYIQEQMYGVVSWDYTSDFLNICGRTKITYMIGFGLIGVVFIKLVYPLIEKLYYKLNIIIRKTIVYCLLIFTIFNVAISIYALERYYDRTEGIKANSDIDLFLDKYYPDNIVKKHVTKMKPMLKKG